MTKIIMILFSAFFLWSQGQAQNYSKEAKSYFKEIALGSEYGNSGDKTIKKWVNDIVVFVPQNMPDYLVVELDKVISELNLLIQPIKIYKTTQQSKANLRIFVCTAEEYLKAEPKAKKLVAGNLGLFYVYPNAKGEIQKGTIFIDNHRLKAHDTQKHILREEFTQSLGLMNDSERYPNSIFYQKWSRTQSFSDLDREVISILYSEKIKAGLNEQETNIILI